MIKRFIDFASSFIEGNRLSGVIIAAAAFALVALLSLTQIYEIFELKLYDLRFLAKPSIQEWDRLTFVDIDENSITNIGQFPWPRYYYGIGAQAMKDLEVSSSTFDIMFPDHSPSHLNTENYVRLVRKAEERKKITSSDLDTVILDNDKRFAQGIAQQGKTVLSYTFNTEPLSENMKERLAMPEYRKAIAGFNAKATKLLSAEEASRLDALRDSATLSISYPIPELMESALSFGFVNRYTDVDGTVRKVRMVQVYRNRLYFNLALVMLIDACGVPMKNVEVLPGDRIVLKNALNPMTHKFGDISIPIDDEGMMYVNWAGKSVREESFHLVPFYALLDYADYAPAVHDYFDRIESQEQRFVLSDIYGKIAEHKRLYARAGSADERMKHWKAIKDLRGEMKKVKESYAAILKNEIGRLEKEPGAGNDRGLKEELDLMKDDLKAIELVIRLEYELADDIAISGLTATGTHDIGTIPLSKEYARVGVYHNTVNTIVNGAFIHRVNRVLNYLLMLLIALGMGISIQRMSARLSVATIWISFAALNTVVVLLFAFFNVWADQLGLNLSLIIPSLSIAGVKFLREESQKRYIKNAFAHYLAPDVIEKIIENPETLELGGKSSEITIFFSDIAGFSTLSEKLTPTQLVDRLNEYLSEMTDIILSHGGTVDKYIGDAIMAFFGAPQPFEDHALRCCLAAIDQKKRLREMQEKWREIGVDEINMRMGINTGEAVVGNMGSRARLNYTAMGDSINLASRLEGANKFFKTNAMISGSTYETVREKIEARRLDTVRVIGKKEAIPVYELLGRKGALPQRMYDMIEAYDRALALFQERQWKRALGQFQAALEIITDDGPSLAYCTRCREYIKNPPPKTWDGVYSFKSK